MIAATMPQGRRERLPMGVRRMFGARLDTLPTRPLLGLLALCLIWGLSIPAMKLGLQTVSPLMLAACRYAVAAPFFAVFLIGRPLPSRRALLAMAGIGVIGIDVGQVAQMVGVQQTEASVATVISAAIPIFVVVLGSWRLRQPLRLAHLAGLMVAMGGIVVVASKGSTATFTLSVSALTGDALVLLSAASIALYYTLSAEITRHYPVPVVAAWSTVFGTLPLLPIIPWQASQAAASPGYAGIAVILYLGLLVTVLGLWIWLNSLRALPVRIVAGTQYLQPLIGVSASAALFAEPIAPSFGIGTVLVFIGIALTATAASKR